MKKRVLLIVLAMVLVAALSVGLTLAYLTSQDSVTNTFTVGQVNITLDEADVDEYGKALTEVTAENGAVDADNDGVVDRVKANSYKLIPGQTYVKDPTVTVKAGSEDCYVRALVTVTYKDAADAALRKNGGANAWFGGFIGQEWTLIGTGDFENLEGDSMKVTYELRYQGDGDNGKVLGAAADNRLPAVFSKFKVPATITGEELQTLTGLKIEVEAHAIQAAGFETADQAWANFKK